MVRDEPRENFMKPKTLEKTKLKPVTRVGSGTLVMRRRPNWKNLLQPYAKQYAAITQNLWRLDTGKLRAIKRACRKVGTSNCWWATFGVARLISVEIDCLLQSRRKIKKPHNV
jgi:hypothetical protein